MIVVSCKSIAVGWHVVVEHLTGGHSQPVYQQTVGTTDATDASEAIVRALTNCRGIHGPIFERTTEGEG